MTSRKRSTSLPRRLSTNNNTNTNNALNTLRPRLLFRTRSMDSLLVDTTGTTSASTTTTGGSRVDSIFAYERARNAQQRSRLLVMDLLYNTGNANHYLNDHHHAGGGAGGAGAPHLHGPHPRWRGGRHPHHHHPRGFLQRVVPRMQMQMQQQQRQHQREQQRERAVAAIERRGAERGERERERAADRHHHHHHHFAQEFIRLHHLMAREQALFAQAATGNNGGNNPAAAAQQQQQRTMISTGTTAAQQAAAAAAAAAAVAQSELTRFLRPIATNDPTCISFTYEISDDDKMQQINAALRRNVVLQQIHLHPSAWKDLKTIKELAAILQHHPSLRQVHLYPTSSTKNFVTQLAVDCLMQSFANNTTTTHWCLHLAAGGVASSGGAGSCHHLRSARSLTAALARSTTTTGRNRNRNDSNSNNIMMECIANARHLTTLELHELGGEGGSSSSSVAALADAIASSSVRILKLIRVDHSALQQIFQACAKQQSQTETTTTTSACALEEIHIESTKEAGTLGLQALIGSPRCQNLQRLTLKNIQTFQRIHADRLVGALIHKNTSVKHVTFMDCCFHPEVVRPLQDLVKSRLDLESFQITRCNADPSMALLTVCANVYNGKMTRLQSVTMGFSLGIEDRLGGDAIRSVLRYNPHLQELNIAGSHRLGETGWRHVARGLGKNQTLRKLDLSHCSIGMASLRLLIQHIAANPNSGLRSINMSHNSLGIQGVQILTNDWLLHENCVLEELILNRCEIYAEAFMRLIRTIVAAQNTTTTTTTTGTGSVAGGGGGGGSSLQRLQVLECGRLGVNELQELAESLFHLGGLKVLKASCFKSPVQPIRPVPHHVGGNHNNAPPPPPPPPADPLVAAAAGDDIVFVEDDSDDDDDDDEDDEDLEMLLEDETAAEMAAAAAAAAVVRNVPPANNNNNNTMTTGAASSGSMKLLKETFLAGLIHNQHLEHISLTNILECVMKPKDALRVRAWMDFCGKRNLMQPLLQQTEIPLLDILTNVITECRDPRTRSLTATGLSLHYYCLRNRPDALDRVQHMLTVEAERRQQQEQQQEQQQQEATTMQV